MNHKASGKYERLGLVFHLLTDKSQKKIKELTFKSEFISGECYKKIRALDLLHTSLTINKHVEEAKENGEKICFVSGEYDYYCHYGFKKLSSINLNIIVPGPISFKDLLIYEFNNDAKNYLKNSNSIFVKIL